MAIVQVQKKLQPQKKPRQKLRPKRKPRRNLQRRNLAISQRRKCGHPSESLEARFLPFLFFSKRKIPQWMKGNKKAVFAQQCLLATQDREQQCYLSNYVSSQARMGIKALYPATVWPRKPPVVKRPVTVRHQQLRALANHLCQDGPQRYVFSSGILLPVLCDKMGRKVCTLTTKDVQDEVNGMISSQLVPCSFARDPGIFPY